MLFSLRSIQILIWSTKLSCRAVRTVLRWRAAHRIELRRATAHRLATTSAALQRKVVKDKRRRRWRCSLRQSNIKRLIIIIILRWQHHASVQRTSELDVASGGGNAFMRIVFAPKVASSFALTVYGKNLHVNIMFFIHIKQTSQSKFARDEQRYWPELE